MLWKVNRFRCPRCGDIVEYVHASKYSDPGFLVTCKCGGLSIDPGTIICRIIYDPEISSDEIEDLSEKW